MTGSAFREDVEVYVVPAGPTGLNVTGITGSRSPAHAARHLPDLIEKCFVYLAFWLGYRRHTGKMAEKKPQGNPLGLSSSELFFLIVCACVTGHSHGLGMTGLRFLKGAKAILPPIKFTTEDHCFEQYGIAQ